MRLSFSVRTVAQVMVSNLQNELIAVAYVHKHARHDQACGQVAINFGLCVAGSVCNVSRILRSVKLLIVKINVL